MLTEKQICEVCLILDGDPEEKECVYCLFCRAWICLKDQCNWGRRTDAAVKKMRRAFQGDKK